MSDCIQWRASSRQTLPNELLHKVILWVLCDSVHSICVSTEETTWELNVIDTLSQVSPTFKAIAEEIAGKAFAIPRMTREYPEGLSKTLRKIFDYLYSLSAQLRHPSDQGNLSAQSIDCSASCLLYAYALYMRSISYRRNASRSHPGMFEESHNYICSALAESQVLCKGVNPTEITWLLRDGMEDELEMSASGLAIVQGFDELSRHANSMIVLQSSQAAYGTGPLAAVRSMIHTSLSKIESVHDTYTRTRRSCAVDAVPRIYQLPGVLDSLRKIHALTFDDDEYGIERRIRRFVDEWAQYCPFLNPLARPLLSESC